MGANTEYTEYFLTDEGWIQGDQKFSGEAVKKRELPADIKARCYKHIRIVSEMRTGGSLNGCRSVEEIFCKSGCEQKIADLMQKYPESELC